MRAPALLAEPRRIAHGLVRRHRRPLAAALAATGVLLALASVRGAVAEPAHLVDAAVTAAADPAALRPGEVGVPVTLATDGVASLLAVGDLLDLIAVDDGGGQRVVASSARVVQVPAAGGGLSASSGDLVVVAVPDAQAREVAVAGAGDAIVVVLRAAAARR